MDLDFAAHSLEVLIMESKEKAFHIAVALVANGTLKFDLDDCLAGIQAIEQAQQKIYEGYKDRSAAKVSAALDSLKGFKP